MKKLLKASIAIVTLMFLSWAGVVIAYHCNKDFRWMIKDIVAEQEFKDQMDIYVAKGVSQNVIDKRVRFNSIIGGAFRDVQRMYEPEFVPFALPFKR